MEKSLFNQVGEVKGKVSESEESFSFQFTPQNENLRRTRGSLFTLVTVEGKAEDRFEKAKAYYHSFQSSYYAKASGSIINGLSETLDQLEKDFAPKEEGLKYSLVAAVFWGAVLYLARSSGGSVWVSRSERLKKIDFNKVASGVLEDNDTVCLVTKKFEAAISQEDLSKWLALEKFEEVLSQIDKSVVDIEGASCVVIRLSVHAPEEVQPLAIGEVNEEGAVEEPEIPVSEEAKESGEEEAASEEIKSFEPEKTLQTPSEFNPLEERRSKSNKEVIEKLKPIFGTMAGVGGKIFAKIASPWRKQKAGELVDHVAIRRQRLAQVVVVIVLILAFSLMRSFSGKQTDENQAKFDTVVASVETQLDEARSIKSIDPSRASTLVNEAKDSLEEAKGLEGDNSKISSLESEIAGLIAEITRSYKIDSLNTVFDFSKVEAGAAVSRIALSGETILATDKDKNLVYSLDLTSKSGSKVGGSFSSPDSLGGYEQGFYIINSTGVIRYENAGGKTTALADATNWGKIVGAATFQANLYLLDQGKQEVWRYLNTSTGLSSVRAYISGEKPDLTRATAMAIDDYVWVVTQDGEVYKFAQGKKQEFALTNITEELENVVDIFTNNSVNNIYLLDKGKGRVVVIGKDGVYQKQFSHEDFRKATSIVVKEDQKTAYIAINGKVVSFELK